MSRTIRRKGMNKPTGWYSYSREDFDYDKADYLSDEWRGVRKYWHYALNRWVECQRKWHRHDVVQHNTFDDLCAYERAIFHSDGGYNVHGHEISASFRRCIEKKYRSQRNQQLRSAIVRGEEEDLLLTPHRHDIAWWY